MHPTLLVGTKWEFIIQTKYNGKSPNLVMTGKVGKST